MSRDDDPTGKPASSHRQASAIWSPLLSAVAVLWTNFHSARSVFLAWEGLRLVYNAILIFLTLTLAIAFGDVTDPLLWEAAIPGAIVANIAFCLGPCAEGYLALIGADRRLARGLVFSAGLSLASLLALLAILQIFTPLGWD